MENPKTRWWVWAVAFIGVGTILTLLFIVRTVWPVTAEVAMNESIKNSVHRAGTTNKAGVVFLDAESLAVQGNKIHINSVNMIEPGFIAVYYDNGTVGKSSVRYLGASTLLPTGKKEDFDIPLTQEINCADLAGRPLEVALYKDLNGNGQFDVSVEGEGAATNMNGEPWIMNPDYPVLRVLQTVEVRCR